MASTKTIQDAVILFLSDARGQYIPRDFIDSIDVSEWDGISEEDAAILSAGPDHEQYWDAWSDVCDRATFTDAAGAVYHIWQDGDCWLLCYERMSQEEKDNFGFED